MIIKRGDIYYADLSPVVGSEQGGVRPVLIVQNDIGNKYSPTVIAAAITSQINKAKLPTHIEISAQEYGLQKDSVILLEQIPRAVTVGQALFVREYQQADLQAREIFPARQPGHLQVFVGCIERLLHALRLGRENVRRVLPGEHLHRHSLDRAREKET